MDFRYDKTSYICIANDQGSMWVLQDNARRHFVPSPGAFYPFTTCKGPLPHSYSSHNAHESLSHPIQHPFDHPL